MLKEILIKSVFAEEDLPNFNDPELFSGGNYSDLTLTNVFVVVANIIIYVGWGLVLIFLALGFIKFITSQGDKTATEQAQKWVTYSIIGGVGLLLVYAIRGVISNLIGGSI